MILYKILSFSKSLIFLFYILHFKLLETPLLEGSKKQMPGRGRFSWSGTLASDVRLVSCSLGSPGFLADSWRLDTNGVAKRFLGIIEKAFKTLSGGK